MARTKTYRVIRDDRGRFWHGRKGEWIDSCQRATHYPTIKDLPVWFDDPIGSRAHLELNQEQTDAWYHSGTEYKRQVIARVVEVVA